MALVLLTSILMIGSPIQIWLFRPIVISLMLSSPHFDHFPLKFLALQVQLHKFSGWKSTLSLEFNPPVLQLYHLIFLHYASHFLCVQTRIHQHRLFFLFMFVFSRVRRIRYMLYLMSPTFKPTHYKVFLIKNIQKFQLSLLKLIIIMLK